MTISTKFDWRRPEILTSFLQGEAAEELYAQTEGIRAGIEYDQEKKSIYGSTPFLAARVDTLVRPLGLRVATLRDLSRPEVMEMISGKHYSDTPALVVRSEKDPNYSKNNPILGMLIEEASRRHEKLPFLATGFDVAPDQEDREGYGIKLVPRDDFKLLSDERLDKKYANKKFSQVDESGLPLFDKNGSRTWYARDSGLSGLYLFSDLDLNSNYNNLTDSNSDGRVVLVSGEATQQNFEEYLTKLQEEKETEIAKIEARFIKARKILTSEE